MQLTFNQFTCGVGKCKVMIQRLEVSYPMAAPPHKAIDGINYSTCIHKYMMYVCTHYAHFAVWCMGDFKQTTVQAKPIQTQEVHSICYIHVCMCILV